MSSARDHGRQNWIRRLSWPRGRTVNQIPSRVDGVPFTVHHSAQRARPARRRGGGRRRRRSQCRVHAGASAGGRRPRFLVGAAPRSRASFGCRRLSEWPAHAQRRAVTPPRRLLVSLGLLLVVVRGNRRRFHGLAEPTVAACLRQCPTTSLSSAAMFCSSLPGTVGAPVCLHSAI